MFNFPLENPLSSDQWDVSTSYNTLSYRILDDVTRELCIELHQVGEVVKHLIWVTKLEGAVSLVGILEYRETTSFFLLLSFSWYACGEVESDKYLWLKPPKLVQGGLALLNRGTILLFPK